LAKPILSPISVFDANEGTTAYFKVATTYDGTLYNNAQKAYDQAIEKQKTTIAAIKSRGVETYGNIDNLNRARIVWTSENIAKYQTFVNEMNSTETIISKGDYSTVLGSDDKMGSLQVAYTPLFQTDNSELIPLTQSEISKYLSDVKTKATAMTNGLVAANILSVDAEGISETVGGSAITVKKMIAAVEGDTFDGAPLSACDVSAIAGWSEAELKKTYGKTSTFVGWAMHDVQGKIWSDKDNVTEKTAALEKATTTYCYEVYDSMTNKLLGSVTNAVTGFTANLGYGYRITSSDWLDNQSRNYTIRVKVRLSGEDEYGDFSDPIPFWCKEKPILSFDGLSSNAENIIPTSSILFLLAYQYVTAQGETLSTYQYHLYDESKNLIKESAVFYGAVGTSFTVNGLDNRTVFYIRGTGTTRNGYSLDTGFIQFETKYYASAEGGTFLQCKNKLSDGYVAISSHLADISGITKDQISYVTSSGGYAVDLTHGEKVTFDIPYQMEFYNVKDYAMAFKVRPIVRKNIVEFSFDQDGMIYRGVISTNIRAFSKLSYESYLPANQSEYFYAMLKIIREDGGFAYSDVYFIDSNYMKRTSMDVLICLQHKDNAYDITIREVEE
jgi:hypothetical protein